MSITLYGLKNCDTCRTALKDLKAAGVEHTFVDMRADGVGADQIAGWAGRAGWDVLLNRRGTTWRGLGDDDKADLDEAKAVRLMAQHPALIKRPVIESGGSVAVGYSDAVKNKLTSTG
jgi:Spx/MgsR family transcriptional regulator